MSFGTDCFLCGNGITPYERLTPSFMAFSATKRELGELYTFFRLLADGAVSLGTPKAEKDETLRWPVALIQREEHDGTRRYYIEAQEVRVVSGTAGSLEIVHPADTEGK